MSTDLAQLPSAALPYVHWALDHWQRLPQIAGDLADVESAAGIDARWSAVKAAGDDIVKVLEDFPGLAAAPLTMAAVQTIVDEHPALQANGQIINILIQNLPQILAFITQILPLFKG